MSELYGLQISLQCIRCGNPPAQGINLYEMMNHLYICGNCIGLEKAKGKQVLGVDGQHINISQFPGEGKAQSPRQIMTPAFPMNNIFCMPGITIGASLQDVKNAIKRLMMHWTREPASAQKEQMIETLRLWQLQIINDPDFLTKEASRLFPKNRQELEYELLVGQKPVSTLQEFVNRCEQSAEGWQDGEAYLKSGDLKFWVLLKTDKIDLARALSPARPALSSFQALNQALYLLWSERPFRLYQQQQWEAPTPERSASTLIELVSLCDLHWESAKDHLYHGSLLFWLEFSHGCSGLSTWLEPSLQQSANNDYVRSLVLELALEKAIPSLIQPDLNVTIDNFAGRYRLLDWDSEIGHRPLTLKLDNKTRGASLTTLELVSPPDSHAPGWIDLEEDAAEAQQNFSLFTMGRNRSVVCYNRPGEINPVKKKLFLHDLQYFRYKEKRTCLLRVIRWRKYLHYPLVYEYPIEIRVMSYRQGFRRYLWLCGLRGNLPGLFWNFVAGAFITLPFLGLLATVALLLSPNFIWVFGLLAGLIGMVVGFGKGHTNYPLHQQVSDFRTGALLTGIIACIVLLFLNRPGEMAHGIALDGVSLTVGAVLAYGLIVLLFGGLFLLRLLLEWWLRKRYAVLLRPCGSI
jgi:hypothetical protein